jgi:hypothetical protein
MDVFKKQPFEGLSKTTLKLSMEATLRMNLHLRIQAYDPL